MLLIFKVNQHLASQKESTDLFSDLLVKFLILNLDLICAHVY